MTQQMIYTRPNIITEAIRLTAVRCGPHLVHYAIFSEKEAGERLESGLWVDHPNKIYILDEAIEEAKRKEAERESREQKSTQAEQEIDEQRKKLDAVQVAEGQAQSIPAAAAPTPEDEKLTGDQEHHEGETIIASEQPDGVKVEPKKDEPKDEPKAADTKADDAKKDGQKVDGQKVDTKAKGKK
ncbi:hypothetical protein ABR33_05865 [Enterobacter bugandensis]|uniref:hypothetical protein n=1 Tax=Enterobacter bugandensis TaxID=881260 RepID=UPI0006434AF3|nr:hypothetical protein [Enterobacter bugandensis]KLQ32521.1 hypothetical protein ABR33_05865 [Enterobacter bugandensis]